jgi:tetratricopeptide (TPR) repeat protein
MNRILLLLLLLPAITHGQDKGAYADWTKKATILYEAGRYHESSEAYSHAFAVLGGKGYMDDRYNAARAWAMAGNKDSALFNLVRIAEQLNYADTARLFADADLASLHGDERWTALCTRVRLNKEKAEANLDKGLAAKLDTIFDDDQRYRQQIGDIKQQYGEQSVQMRELWKRIEEYDSVNVIKVTAILQKYGWPGPDIAGERGTAAVFYVIQHAGIGMQDKYLPMLREAVKDKKLQPYLLAMLEDRVAMRHGKRQIYGSQVSCDVNGCFLAPIDDPDHVDKRRDSVGLEPIGEYVKNFGLSWNLDEYKKDLPAIEKRQAVITY